MKKEFTEADMTSFGNFLLSPLRAKSFAPGIRKKEHLKTVHAVDFENWKAKGKHRIKLNNQVR